MERSNVQVLKSEKISQKNKFMIVSLMIGVVFLITLISFIVDYIGYKKGQEYGMACVIASSEIGGADWVSNNESYSEKCEKIYIKLNAYTPDYKINGEKIDASDVRKSQENLRKAFYKIMKDGGFDKYYTSEIAKWFLYTNPIQYYTGYYWRKVMPMMLYICIVLGVVSIVSLKKEGKKEIVVYEDSVICKSNSKKTKQMTFKDIQSVETGKNSLTIIGSGIRFKIKNVLNGQEIRSYIILKKNELQNVGSETTAKVSDTDELRKYKELLDEGVISEEEFSAKKKQLLGL